jgi:hypothetical protein
VLTPLPEEVYLSTNQVAEKLNLSHDLVRKLFAREPGVLALTRPAKRHKRTYTTLRIPGSVLNRVVTRMTVQS